MNGVVMYNKGSRCAIKLAVCVDSLRRHWQGPVTMFLEEPYPLELLPLLKENRVDVIHDNNPSTGVMVRKVEICKRTPYDRSLWIDADCLVVGGIGEMFEYLDDHDVAIAHFADWMSDGRVIRARIKGYAGMASDEIIAEALDHHPAINCGVLSWRKNAAFLDEWLELAKKGDGKMYIPDEVAFQTLYPRWRTYVANQKFNVSVRFGEAVEDKRIIHYHGKKNTVNLPLCDLWKREFNRMLRDNVGNMPELVKFADRRHKQWEGSQDLSDVTLVTACDPRYVEYLRVNYPRWVELKKLGSLKTIVFINGMDGDDPRLDFMRRPNVRFVPWSMPGAESHREEMLSAFVFGAAREVDTDYWLKLDADSEAVNDLPLVTSDMRRHVISGHRWGYSWAHHIKALDEWGATKGWPPIYDEKCVAPGVRRRFGMECRRYYHPQKRVNSYCQLHSSEFTRRCARLADGRLPAPSHDTYMWYVADRLGLSVGKFNMKRRHGVV